MSKKIAQKYWSFQMKMDAATAQQKEIYASTANKSKQLYWFLTKAKIQHRRPRIN